MTHAHIISSRASSEPESTRERASERAKENGRSPEDRHRLIFEFLSNISRLTSELDVYGSVAA